MEKPSISLVSRRHAARLLAHSVRLERSWPDDSYRLVARARTVVRGQRSRFGADGCTMASAPPGLRRRRPSRPSYAPPPCRFRRQLFDARASVRRGAPSGSSADEARSRERRRRAWLGGDRQGARPARELRLPCGRRHIPVRAGLPEPRPRPVASRGAHRAHACGRRLPHRARDGETSSDVDAGACPPRAACHTSKYSCKCRARCIDTLPQEARRHRQHRRVLRRQLASTGG